MAISTESAISKSPWSDRIVAGLCARALLASLLAAVYTGASAQVTHDAEVVLQPDGGRIEVTDRVRLDGRGPYRFRLAEGLRVQQALIDGVPVTLRRVAGAWQLPQVSAGEIELHYAGALSSARDTDEPLGPSGAVLGPEGGFLPAGSGWLPEFQAGPVSYRLQVSIASPWRVVATGTLSDSALDADVYQAVFEASDTPRGPSLFAGHWQSRQLSHSGVRLWTWFDPEDQALADRYLQAAAAYIDRYSALIGPYPYRDFHMVSAPFPVGLGFPGLAYISRRILSYPYMSGRSLAHEVLHNWWGNGVYVDYRHGNWSEGLTTYLADHALAEQQGPEVARQMRLAWLRDYAALPVAREQPLTAFTARFHDAQQVIGYGKSAFVFHMLRQWLGERDFREGLRQLWQSKRFQTAAWSDLQQAFETASGRDLQEFFEQWLQRPGAPRLRILAADPAPGGVRLVLAQLKPAYALQVPVLLQTGNGELRLRQPLAELYSEATLSADSEVLSVRVDPDYDLFRRLSPGEVPAVLRDLTLRADARCVLALDGPEAGIRAQALADRLMDTPVSCEDIGVTDADGRPLLLVASDTRLWEALRQLSLGAEPALPGTGGTARVWAGRTEAQQRFVVISVADLEALDALLRPLPHYARQSYLRFSGTRVTERGVWPVNDQGLYRCVDAAYSEPSGSCRCPPMPVHPGCSQ